MTRNEPGPGTGPELDNMFFTESWEIQQILTIPKHRSCYHQIWEMVEVGSKLLTT